MLKIDITNLAMQKNRVKFSNKTFSYISKNI
jgi:hypothetical protein